MPTCSGDPGRQDTATSLRCQAEGARGSPNHSQHHGQSSGTQARSRASAASRVRSGERAGALGVSRAPLQTPPSSQLSLGCRGLCPPHSLPARGPPASGCGALSAGTLPGLLEHSFHVREDLLLRTSAGQPGHSPSAMPLVTLASHGVPAGVGAAGWGHGGLTAASVGACRVPSAHGKELACLFGRKSQGSPLMSAPRRL